VLTLQPLQIDHERRFIEAVRQSKSIHEPWISAPASSKGFRAQLKKCSTDNNKSFVAVNEAEDVIACVNFNEIVRGFFHSAYLGFYVFAPFQGLGLMRQAMTLTITHAFDSIELHRLEANIQPANERSIALVRSLGFRHEGYSPRYLYINDDWRDHERYALTVEEWAP
jgi:ribosomal-protein-alanine N-acetyltransferase